MEHLILELKQASLDDDAGELTGYGNVTGNVDRGSDMVLPGAYQNLDEFVRSGFGAVAHDHTEFIATIEEAYEDENGLFVRMQFHTTPEAQKCRTVVRERLERGKTIGLSIGYQIMPNGVAYENGVRFLKALQIFEVSIVTVPMNPQALVTSVKGVDDAPYLSALSAVVDAVDEIALRTRAKHELRLKNGRRLSRSNREMLEACCDRITHAREAIREVLAASDESKQATPADVARVLQRRAEMLGGVFR